MTKGSYNIFRDDKFLRFLIVGGLNTLIGTSLMFGLYNIAGVSYWKASAINYTLTSIFSYYMNRTFTFKYRGGYLGSAIRFAANIATCYLIAYGVAKPVTYFVLSGYSAKIRDNIAMLVGMLLFTLLNYFGQRVFAFKEE